MSSSDFAIEVKNLGKIYNIYNRPQDRLKQSLVPRLQQLIGREPKRYFREFWALRNISFEVKKGETVGIIGRNGSGKSTLLEIICGTLSSTIGTVSTRGRIAALLELGSGFNPQFSGRENVYLNGAILGLSKQEIDSRFHDIAQFADIGDFIEQPVKIYSSGMIVRLAFAVQAMVDPDILVVDEALAVGDEKFQRKCFARLEELKTRGTAILFVSHSGRQIIELCDRVLLLEQGNRLLFAEPLQVVRAYQKLIYAPIDQQADLVKAYKAADKAGVAPESVNTDLPQRIKADLSKQINSSDGSTANREASFDPELMPATTVVYPNQGGRIDSIQILDSNRQPVNILLPGSKYEFDISGAFLSNNRKVYFGVHIRSISGTVITGQRHPEEGKFIEQVREGEHFSMTFEFKMILLPGVYFVSGGIWSSEEPRCLHRIMDAVMFRVASNQKMASFGYVNASSAPARLEIRP